MTDDLAERIAQWAQTQANDGFPVYADPIREMIAGHIALVREEVGIVTKELNATTFRAQRYSDTLMRLAARADDYSGPCIRAHVADALGITVKELEARLEAE